MSLARSSLLNGAAVAARLALSLALNKVLALYVGPAGFAVIGQFQSLVALTSALAGGALSNGVIAATAETDGDPAGRSSVWRTALSLALVGALVSAILLLIFARPLADFLLNDVSLASVVVWLALALPFIAAGSVGLALLAGLKRVEAFVAASIAGSALSFGLAIVLVTNGGLHGALLALSVGQAAAAAVTLIVCRRVGAWNWRPRVGKIDGPAARTLGSFGLMAATTSVVAPLSHIVLRDGLARIGDAELAGLWQAMWKLSETHLLLLTTTLSLHLLPAFACIREGKALRDEVGRSYRFVLPLVICTAFAAWLLREPLVRFIFTREFLPLVDALGWQLLGDVLRIASWVPALTMVSHAQVKAFVSTEIAFAIALPAASLSLAVPLGLVGAAMGYALTYAAYWVVVHFQLRMLAASLQPFDATRNEDARP